MGQGSASSLDEVNPKHYEEDDQEDEEGAEFFNSMIDTTDTCSNSDSEIKLCNTGTQICAFQYNILPPVGSLFRVNKRHNLLQFKFRPGQVYQADVNGTLHKSNLMKL